MHRTYADQPHWRAIQAFLPPEFRIGPGQEPAEEWWEHEGHSIHLDTYRDPAAPVKVILLHGVGTNGRQMTTILGRPLAERGYETIAADMPAYGLTEVAPGALVTYDDWVRIAADLVDVELARDDRPIVLYGLSAGGMQAYHVAAVNRRVRGVVGMTFLDQRSRQVATETAVTRLAGRLGTPVVVAAGGSPLRRLRVPMRLVSKMHALVNDKAAARACYRDPTSAGNRVTLAFLRSYLRYAPAVEPADFDVCPVLLTQPAADRWTPLHLSRPFLDELGRVPVSTVLLENAGHYPLEQPGLDQLVNAVDTFCAGVTAPPGD
ncbi:alpha/beta fold hydrolase [Nocardioides sp. LHD-245]|uniref:alpha/beta hydrolase n=1 Tax=Nocardioides sp. LHD-245 TaxID=3051387 RepID=UPI0027E06672|nr:alpha/beta fold hydrolase [Nocardioides sp. LHD-245]